MMILFQSKTYTKDNGEKITYWCLMYLDLNGPAGPNTLGKDIFRYDILLGNNARVEFLDYDGNVNLETGEVYNFRKASHEELIEACKNTNISACGALIRNNGWKFPDDYPLSF
jgi:hypothetical protein